MGVIFFCNCTSVGIQKVAEGSFRPGVGAIIVDVGFLGYRAARTLYKEDFTLPHRFLVIPPGIHMDSRWNLFGREPSQIFVYFHLHSTCIPDGLHGFHPIPHHFTQYFSPFHGLHLDSSSLNNIFCRYWFTNETKSHDGPKNK